ncbi:peptidoglycan DD-metalloendopeptidase family protein [Patescibacteria group bacterium]|nr:peptidoglycan DD-metalloendopeptidase family protein [Patescibacteria group bacterium]MBU4452933.1 peptidoglycan DD-metalloendopeptidase family protein [Patescibacteria group bacterium]
MTLIKRLTAIVLTLSTVLSLSGANLVFAQDQDIKDLQDEISVRKSQIDQISIKVDEYRKKVNEYASQSSSLENDIAMLENETALTDLDIQSTQIEIESQELQIQVLQESIKENSERILLQKQMLSEMIVELDKNDGASLIEIIFSSKNVNDLFSEIEYLETMNADLSDAVNQTKETREKLVSDEAEQITRLDDLVDLQEDLKVKMTVLESQMKDKDTLLEYAQLSENQYKVMLSQTRQEEQYVTQQISAIQAKMDQLLVSSDDYGQETYFTWPMRGVITATFHDPTYPFRNLGEHTGLDIATSAGTPIVAAAPGYVAWAKYGNSYGNYVMVIHANGYATLYAHMSSTAVVADQYVARGDVLGYEGTTGFSTGPHLHFEVRLNGIPVDPQQYLPSY